MERSPFKFLDAYDKEDRDIFFGRDREIDELYKMSYQTNLLLVYGMSGTGKTSLIQCGLANCFDSSDWYEIFIRRQDNINLAFQRELLRHDVDKKEEQLSIAERIHSLYLDYLRPIYLIFDQFEELFILGTEQEQQTFASSIRDLIGAEMPCKIIIVIREEYLAHLSSFEKQLPQLFDKRLRVEPMTRNNAREVIIRSLQKDEYAIQVPDESVADQIIDNITEGMDRVQLTYLQVFLDKMYRVAAAKKQERIVFDHSLVEEVGRIDDVLEGFLEEQLLIFSAEVDERENGMRWLKNFVSNKGTKVPVSRQEVIEAMPEFSEERMQQYFNFFLSNRILRPLDNDQYELTHDSIAQRIYVTPVLGINMPDLDPNQELPANPFIRFEAYTSDMAPLFFGRDVEIRELFHLIVNETQVRTTVVFGPVGVGKTSLIQAGVVPRLRQLFPVATLQLSRELFSLSGMQRILEEEPVEGEEALLLDFAFRWHQRQPGPGERSALFLDQFEELFIWEDDNDHRSHFFQHIHYLLKGGFNCDLILVVRDEYFAQLQEVEAYVPGLMEEQMRVAHIDQQGGKEILQRIAAHADLHWDDPALTERILRNVSEGERKVNLTYLQLYMDKLYRSAQIL